MNKIRNRNSHDNTICMAAVGHSFQKMSDLSSFLAVLAGKDRNDFYIIRERNKSLKGTARQFYKIQS